MLGSRPTTVLLALCVAARAVHGQADSVVELLTNGAEQALGIDDRTPRFSKRLSSAMMSLQTSTHSSQMNTVGPAMSLRTSF